ncbi:hypothetical protein N476_05580 [Pseudoalteromonas luteoviolacea H33]|uniref:Uncharacterized protein n=1 Tax=Pseudoalteromonas luteoviolacea H33 TaxID=1365251 RepID=A0A166ZMH0_9GAMM|nr:hypothetical protein N476_05580 [Pseudoalteromonas luteoviolacea H33]KZN78483.1 hypothetical protein N477_08770 [Pseudoalteromonas luteoviolacea H33-S]
MGRKCAASMLQQVLGNLFHSSKVKGGKLKVQEPYSKC